MKKTRGMKLTSEQRQELLEALKTTHRTFKEICDFLSSDEVEDEMGDELEESESELSDDENEF